MAKYRHRLNDDFSRVKNHIKNCILQSSMSASLEDEEVIYKGNTKIGILVFFNYSYIQT